jgi:DNA-directed RNA polymerase specialized sigma24 family protein
MNHDAEGMSLQEISTLLQEPFTRVKRAMKPWTLGRD